MQRAHDLTLYVHTYMLNCYVDGSVDEEDLKDDAILQPLSLVGPRFIYGRD